MNTREFCDHILKHMTAEEALMKFLEGSIRHYEKLKFDSQQNVVHPEIIISMATFDLGWQMVIEKEGDGNNQVRGMAVGTAEYLDSIFKKENKIA